MHSKENKTILSSSGIDRLEALIQEIPADRMGHTDEVAELVKMLCTGNEYLTGQIITLDGGWT